MTYTFESMIHELLKGEQQHIDAYFSCYQEPLGKSIKIIQHKITIDQFLSLSDQYHWSLTPQDFTPNRDVYYISRKDDQYGLGKHRLHTAGFFYMQEIAASLPVQFLPIQQGDIVLDMCAAPGGKSIQICDKGGFVISNEVSGSRIIPLQYNLNRTGMYKSCVTSIQGGQRGNLAPNFFDHILVDAPCSGEGTGFKSDDGIKRRQQDNILKIARLQKELLASAIKACKPGGTIIYATCTINPRENEGVIADVLQKFGDMISLTNVDIDGKSCGITGRQGESLLTHDQSTKVARFWPHIQKTGGFFIAALKKKYQYTSSTGSNKIHDLSSLDMSHGLQEKVATYLNEQFGMTFKSSDFLFVASSKKIYVTSPVYKNIHNVIYTEKTGIPIIKINNNNQWSPLHGLGQCLGDLATTNIVEIDALSIQKYSDGYDIDTTYIPQNSSKYVIIKHNGYSLSVGKVVDTTLKNKYIK